MESLLESTSPFLSQPAVVAPGMCLFCDLDPGRYSGSPKTSLSSSPEHGDAMAKACRKHKEFLLEGKAGDLSEPVPGTGLRVVLLCSAMLGSDVGTTFLNFLDPCFPCLQNKTSYVN